MPLGRSSVVAQLKGQKGSSNQTVVMIGHIDTVGISDYGDFKEAATNPKELMKALKNVQLSPDAQQDYDSGHYVFGRGILDMKCGVAIIMAIMEDLAAHIDEFEGNIVFAAVGDEEGNSGGMLSFVPELTSFKRNMVMRTSAS